MCKKITIVFTFLIVATTSYTQSFAPQVGFEGNLAIHKDSIVFVDWAKDIIINRGFQDIANPNLGYTSYGAIDNALNQANGNPNIISLGDNGEVIVQFNFPIVNGIGADFAVFENGFLQDDNSPLAFLELAFIEVSTDGIEYIRFPAVSENQTNTQIGSFEFMDARYIYNFAGKYINNYGTPFDLDELINLSQNTSIDLNNIQYIKIIDVIGSINTDDATYDSQNNIVNDPYPTAFPSGGFDLDAVGVIHNTQNTTHNFTIYPNPTSQNIFIQNREPIKKITVFSLNGKLLLTKQNTNSISISTLKSGIYILEIETNTSVYKDKIIKI